MRKFEVKDCIGFRVRQISRMLDNKYREIVMEYGISEKQLGILFYLNEIKQIEQGKMGESMVLERSTVSRNLKLLEKKGLISRSSGYRPVVSITQKGSKAAADVLPRWERLMNELYATLGKDGVKALEIVESKIKL